jgi:hypothetical protein
VIGVGVIGIIFLLGVGSLVLSIMTVVSASKYPDWAFQQTGSSKFVWQILPIILIFACGWAGGVMGLIWFSSKRDQIEQAARRGGNAPYGYGPPPQQYGMPQQPYGAPPPGWGPPPGPGTWSPPQQPPPPGSPLGYPPPQPPEQPPL